MQSRIIPTSCRVRQTIYYQSGTHLSSDPKRYLRKNPGSHPDNLQLAGLQIPAEMFRTRGSIWTRGYRTHLPSSCESTSTRTHIANWIFVSRTSVFVVFKTDFVNSNCNSSRDPEDPSRARPLEVMKFRPLHCLHYLENTIVTGTC